MPPQGPLENKPSDLLSDEENQKIFRLLGNRCQTIATAVAQLFCTEAPSHAQWCKVDTGILCYVKDNMKKNYFFRMFCLRRNMMIWEHEMYNNFEYIESTPHLHMFEGEEGIIAFNFASSDEARQFKIQVDGKILTRKKREERRMKQSRENSINKTPVQQGSLQYRKVPDQAAKLAKRRRNITKADIGIPLDFKHISHVGWDPNSGFDLSNIQDETLKKFFDKAGVSEKQLQDRDTREFIYDFIAKHGGRDAVEQQTNHQPTTPIKPPPPEIPPAVENTGPPVPPRGPMRPHGRAAPPPPPSSKKPMVMNSAPPKPPPAPPTVSNFLPPPPPPMPVDISGSTTPTACDSKSLNSMPTDLNLALAEHIQNATLRSVDERKAATVSSDNRSDLLSEIRKGFKLKPVEEREVKQISNVVEQGGNDLAGALARALAERSKAIHSEDDDDDDEDSNDDEWEE